MDDPKKLWRIRMTSRAMNCCASVVFALGVCLGAAAPSWAADVEYLMVPSPAMGRDIPVAFLAGGPHAWCSWTHSTQAIRSATG